MKILISLVGQLRTFKECYQNLKDKILNFNSHHQINFVFNTSSFNNQDTKFESQEELESQLKNTFNLSNLNIIYQNIENPKYPGIFYDRILQTKLKIDFKEFDFILIKRFDCIWNSNPIVFDNLDKSTLYFADGKTSNWFFHDYDTDYFHLGTSTALDLFLGDDNFHFYHQLDKSFYTYDKIENLYKIFYQIPLNSRWKTKYNDLEKINFINNILFNYKNCLTLDKYHLNKVKTSNECNTIAYNLNNLYQNNYKIEILGKVKLVR